MPLPKITVPKYGLTLPSNGEKVKYRPFLVKEEKVLHMAMEAGDNESQIEAMINVLTDCLEGKDEEYVREMPVFDVEYCFLQIRSKSIGEITKPSVVCKACEEKVEVEIDLSKIRAKKNANHNNKIELSEGVGVIMKYPSVTDVGTNVSDSEDPSSLAINILIDCIDMIYDSKDTYKASEYSREELLEFVDGLTKENFDKITEFFETMPKITKKVAYHCPKCGCEDNIEVEGIENFFG